MLVSDLINLAFEDLGAIAAGETITSGEQTDAFARLNTILDQWSAEELSVYTIVHQSFSLVAATSEYTLGAAGTFATSGGLIPVCVTGALGVKGAFRGSIKVVSFAELHATAEDGLGELATLPSLLAADQAYPTINLQFHPVPASSAATVWLDYWTALAQFGGVGSTVTLPPAYLRALVKNLALELYPQYARPGSDAELIAGMAQSTKQSIVDHNAKIAGAATAAK